MEAVQPTQSLVWHELYITKNGCTFTTLSRLLGQTNTVCQIHHSHLCLDGHHSNKVV